MFRFDLADALSELDADPRCVFDPPCRRSFGGSCAACLHASEVACERFNTVLDRNLLSCILCCRDVAPELMHRKNGRIITIGSIAGTFGRDVFTDPSGRH